MTDDKTQDVGLILSGDGAELSRHGLDHLKPLKLYMAERRSPSGIRVPLPVSVGKLLPKTTNRQAYRAVWACQSAIG